MPEADTAGTPVGRADVSSRSLEDLLATAGSPVELLRNATAGPNVYPGVPPEFTNWRDEQRAWQETCVLFNLSYHMNDLAVEGPDALSMLSDLAVNSFDGYSGDRAKHFVPCSPDGFVIGDVILFALGDDRFDLVGRAPALNWIIYHAETGGYDVAVGSRPEERAAYGRTPQILPFPGAGPERDAGDREGARWHSARARVLPHHDGDAGGQDRGRVAPRHGRTAGVGALRPVGRREGGSRGARDGRRGARSPPGRRTCLLVQHTRVRLDPFAASGRVLRREHEGLPRVAARDRLRGIRLARRQLRLRPDRGLLLHAVGSRLRELRRLRSRLRRTSRVGGDGPRRAPQESHARA